MQLADFTAIDHIQLAMPTGREDAAREFFIGLLGMRELTKPINFAKRGGVWFATGTVQIHLGVEADFRPAKKAHPAVRCRNYGKLLAHLRASGIDPLEDAEIPGVSRCYIHDPFGNRIELVAED